MIFPHDNIFSSVVSDPIPGRTSKPRTRGITMVIDKGLGAYALEDLLETAGLYVDVIKFGFGTSSVYSTGVLQRKTALCRLYSVDAMTGGTLAEIAMAQGQFELFVDRCLEAGFSAIEISDGTLPIPREVRNEAIRHAAARCMVVSEVGKKLEKFPDVNFVADQIIRDLESGAQWVIVEGRESGENVGIYGAGGKVDVDVLEGLVGRLPQDVLPKVLWEAPKRGQQLEMLRRFGPDVNLGNILPEEAVALECLRRGLRADTFVWTLPSQPE